MPTDQSTKLRIETESLRAVYAAINRNDIPSALKFFDPRIERIEFEGLPSAGVYRGHAEVKTHLSRARETWAEGSCEPERFIAAGDRIIVFLHVRVRLKNKLDWNEGRIADVFTFGAGRDGKVIQMRTFADRQQALEWAGVKDLKTC